MSADRIDEQDELAGFLAEMLEMSGHDVTKADLLDDLASCGLKLKRLVPDDFTPDGVSVVSHAYHRVVTGEQ